MRAIRTQDVARLTRIPGVGKKTAERIGLELKDRLPATLPSSAVGERDAATGDELRDDLLSALAQSRLPTRRLAEKAIDAALKKAPDARVRSRLLRDVLRG